MNALERFELDGKLTEREHQWTVGIATDVFNNVEDVTGWISFASDLADLVVELPISSATGLTALAVGSGCLALAAPFIQFVKFAIIIGETYETDLRIYGSVAIAYTITSWALDEERQRPRRLLEKGPLGK